MFHTDDFDEDDWFKKHRSAWESTWEVGRGGAMDIVIGLACVVGLAVLLALLCRCCRATRHRGRVLQPAPAPNSSVPAPYPQQQYSTVTVTTLPVGQSVGAPYPTGGAPYPTGGVNYPTAGAPYPSGPAPYPSNPAPYPTAGAPYPGAAGPYPQAGAPYHGAAGYPGMPHPGGAPSAPDAHTFMGIAPPGWHAQALPPSYDQVMSNEAKHPPFNPYAPQ